MARNPVTCKYAREHAALGAVKEAINLGRKMINAREKGPMAVIHSVCDHLGGEVVTLGNVEEVILTSRGGFDVGKVIVGKEYEITFWNEYMTLEKSGERIATFPDLIATIDAENGVPVTSAEIRRDMHIAIVKVKKENLKLGAGMRDPALFKPCEEATGKKIIDYVFQ